jgi:hypothetical protein
MRALLTLINFVGTLVLGAIALAIGGPLRGALVVIMLLLAGHRRQPTSEHIVRIVIEHHHQLMLPVATMPEIELARNDWRYL